MKITTITIVALVGATDASPSTYGIFFELILQVNLITMSVRHKLCRYYSLIHYLLDSRRLADIDCREWTTYMEY